MAPTCAVKESNPGNTVTGALPVPVKGMMMGSLMLIEADRVPGPLGVKVTFNWHVPPTGNAAGENGQVVDAIWKSPLLTPVNVAEVMDSGVLC